MATDAYIAFGQSDGRSPYGLPLPEIEGDSTDAWHYWWCELRSCGFDLQAKDWKTEVEGTDAEENEDKKKAKAEFKPVKLAKRVDWASSHMFYWCCQQAMALSKSEEERKNSEFKLVIVEVCRQTGATVDLNGHKVVEKIPYLTVRYKDVRITHYSISMDGPEPSESITFEYGSMDFEHIRTDPETGLKVTKDAVTKAIGMANSTPGVGGTGNTAGGTGGESTAPSATPAVVVAPNSGNTGSSGGAAVPAGGGSAVDAAAGANYPGLWQGTGFGILPD